MSYPAAAALLAPALLAAAVTACGDDASSRPPEAAETEGFPVTVEHDLGTTDIPAAPERIVTVGLTEQDTVLALGLTPVGVTEWYGDQPHATWPWAQDELGDAEPTVLSQTDGLQYEAIAALDPDLILGLNAGLDEESYERLSEIAPTVAHPPGAEPYFSEWRDQVELIGRAVGRPDEATALVEDIDAAFAEAAAAHPEFAGVPAILLQNAFYDGQAIAYQEGLSTDFLTDLGFAIPAELDPFVTEADGSQAFIPLEQLSTLDAADVLIWATEKPQDRAALEAEPVYASLEEVQAGRLVFTDGLTAGAIYFASPLSLPYVLDRLVPALAGTLSGNGPATTG